MTSQHLRLNVCRQPSAFYFIKFFFLFDSFSLFETKWFHTLIVTPNWPTTLFHLQISIRLSSLFTINIITFPLKLKLLNDTILCIHLVGMEWNVNYSSTIISSHNMVDSSHPLLRRLYTLTASCSYIV